MDFFLIGVSRLAFQNVSGSISGGEFESSFSELAEQIGCWLLPATAVSPTQNAPCERAGGAWRYRARRLAGPVFNQVEKWKDSLTKLWLCAVLSWLTNTAIGDTVGTVQASGYLVDPCVSLFSSCLVHHSWHLTNDTVMTLPINVVLPC